MKSLPQTCLQILQQPEPAQKVALVLGIEQDVLSSHLHNVPMAIPDQPVRPNGLTMVTPGKAPKRKWGSEAGRLALLHAIAHIELNAIDLAFDMIARFAFSTDIDKAWQAEFCKDWLRVGQEEARHFTLITDLLNERGIAYGDLPVHGGMWDAAVSTSDCVLARLAIAPLVLEARGLDVTPPMIEKLQQAGDEQAVTVLQVIYTEEIGHVAIGAKWFKRICQQQELNPKDQFQHLVKTRYTSTLKPPFNVAARTEAGLPEEFYS